MISRVLLKELPFIPSGSIVDKNGDRFSVDRGETLYDGSLFGGSHNGVIEFEDNENDLIDAIWDNKCWFSDICWTQPRWSIGRVEPISISISFACPIPQRHLLQIARGISRTLSDHYKSTVLEMGWTDTNLTDIDFGR